MILFIYDMIFFCFIPILQIILTLVIKCLAMLCRTAHVTSTLGTLCRETLTQFPMIGNLCFSCPKTLYSITHSLAWFKLQRRWTAFLGGLNWVISHGDIPYPMSPRKQPYPLDLETMSLIGLRLQIRASWTLPGHSAVMLVSLVQ